MKNISIAFLIILFIFSAFFIPTYSIVDESNIEIERVDTIKEIQVDDDLSNEFDNIFLDIHEDDWFYDSVIYCKNKNFISGVSEKTFAPFTPVNRETFITILWRIDGSKYIENELHYKDLSSNWSLDAIKWANQNSIMYGFSDIKFGTKNYISLEQLMTILYRYTQYRDISVEFEDFDINDDSIYTQASTYAINPIKWGITNNLISKNGENCIPNSKLSRAKLSYILKRYNEIILEQNLEDIKPFFVGEDKIDERAIFQNRDGELINQILDYVKLEGKNEQDIAIWIENLNTNEVFIHNPEKVFVAASTYKLPLALVVYDEILSGNINLTDKYEFLEKHLENGGMVTDNYDIGDKISVDYLLTNMILYSDNSAARILFGNLGGSNNFHKLASKYSDGVDYYELSKDGNFTNAKYLYDTLKHLYINSDNYTKLLNDMKEAKGYFDDSKLSVEIAQKWGLYDGNKHCVGIVYSDTPYIIVVLTKDFKSDVIIPKINSMVYNYFSY